MNVPEMIGAGLIILGGIVLTIVIMLQNPKSDGISSLAGAGSFLAGGGQDRSVDAKVNKLVKVLCVAFFVVTIVVYAFTIYL